MLRCNRNKNKVRYFVYLLISVLIISLFTACSKVSDEELIAARKAFKEGALMIDVRTPSEFKQRHIAGAHNIPLHVLGKVYMHLPKDKEIIVYCQAGNRSETAAEFLREQGWKVHDVATQEDWFREID